MRGSPILRFLAIGAFLALAGIPIWSLTHREEPEASHSETPDAGTHEVEISVTSAREAMVTLSYAGTVVLQSRAPSTTLTGQLALPAEGADLVVHASWQDTSAPNAVRVTAKCDGAALGDATFWGESSAEDVLTVGGTP
jgi:hypothetical protein